MVASKADRAKQFIPFDALKGLQEALKKKEIEHEEQYSSYKKEDANKSKHNY